MWNRLFGRRTHKDATERATDPEGAGTIHESTPDLAGASSSYMPPGSDETETARDIRIETTAEGEVWWITLRGKLNGPDAAVQFTRAVEAGMERGFRKFLIDLGEASWVDSTGIGAIASTSVRVRDAGGSFVLTRVGDRIQRVLEVTRMDQILECEVDRETALRRLAG